MQRHIVVVIVVMLLTVTLSSAWFVGFLNQNLNRQQAGQIFMTEGQVEMAGADAIWKEATLDTPIVAGMQIKTGAGSSTTLWLDTQSRLVLAENTLLHYQGYQAGKPSWNLVQGAMSGRLSPTTKPLTLKVQEATLTVAKTSFVVTNTATEQSVLSHDEPLTLTLQPDSQATPVTTSLPVGEIYHLQMTTAITTTELESEVLLSTTPTASASATPPLTDDSTIPLEFAASTTLETTPNPAPTTTTPETYSLTVVGAQPKLSFIWTDRSANPTAKQFRLLRGATTPLTATTATAFRSVTGQGTASFIWALPDTAQTYVFRVCRLEKNTCTAYSNTVTIPANTY